MSFAKEAEPISGCFGTKVSFQMAVTYVLLKGQGRCPQMGREKPEEREIQGGLFLFFSHNRKLAKHVKQ